MCFKKFYLFFYIYFFLSFYPVLTSIPWYIFIKIKIFKIYEESFSDVAGISRLPVQVGQTLHSNWLYGVVLDDNLDRDLIMDELLEYGIETRPFFYPLHSMNPYKNFSTSTEMSNSEKISLQGLSLPSSVNLSVNKLGFITQTFLKVIGEKIN